MINFLNINGSKKYRFSRTERLHRTVNDLLPPVANLRKTAFLSHFYIKTNILPRQALDKHGENSKKGAVFANERKEAKTGNCFGER
eukprot:COSAG06_NODE_4816_length_3933_cov_8.111633_2_plen_86_part_00